MMSEASVGKRLMLEDGSSIQVIYSDILADMQYSYLTTRVTWQLRMYYSFYSLALVKLQKAHFISDRQAEKLMGINCKMYRMRMQECDY